MPTYLYTGRNADGKPISGKRFAATADNLSTQLSQEGITPIQINAIAHKIDLINLFRNWTGRNKISTDEMGLFTRQMYTLAKTGVPTTIALRQIAENAHTHTMANVIYQLITNLEAGKDLASSMQDFPKIFSPIMVTMIRVGQSSGKLDEAFLRLNEYLEIEAGTFKRLKTVMRYPMLILIAIFIAIVLVNIFVIPAFADIFRESDVPLPWVTKMLIAFSNFFKHYGFYILGITIIAVIMGVYYLNNPRGKYLYSLFLLKLPIFGKIIKQITLLRFSQIFSIVIRSGITVTAGINLTAQGLQNEYAKQEILAMNDEIQRGKNLLQAATGRKLFTPLELQVFAVSEQTGELAELLGHLAEFYRREIEYDLRRITDIIEPLLIFVLSGLVLLLAFAVYLPIWNMVSLVHK